MSKTSGFAAVFGSFALAVFSAGCVSFPDAEKPVPVPMVDIVGSHPSTHHDGYERTMYPLRSSAVKMEVDKEFESRHPGLLGWFFVYWKDRLLDLNDIVSVDLTAGRGFGVNVRPTEYFQAGIGWWDGSKLGCRQRSWGWWDESRVERGLSAFYWLEIDRKARWGTKTLFAQDYEYTGWDIWEERTKAAERDWADFGGSLYVFALGADVNVSPIEFVDAVMGWFPVTFIQNCLGYHTPTFDISADDTWSELRAELVRDRGIADE